MTTKLLVHLHLYYNNQVNYIISKLKNICGCDWDLVVTYVNYNSKSHEKIKRFKPDTKFIKVENYSYDILPFLMLIQSNIDDYDYVLKLHTKNKRNIMFRYNNKIPQLYLKNYEWRNLLFDALLSSPKVFINNLKNMQNNNIGLIGSRILRFDIRKDKNRKSVSTINDLKNQLNISSDYPYFVAGTMFLIKTSVLNRLKYIDLNDERFLASPKTGSYGTYVHAFERIFTILTVDEGYKVYWVRDSLSYIKFIYRYILTNIFSVININKGNYKHKRITILGFKINIKLHQ